MPVGKDEDVACTITNDDQPGTIIIQKLIKPSGSLTSFAFDATGPGTTGTDYVDFSLGGTRWLGVRHRAERRVLGGP